MKKTYFLSAAIVIGVLLGTLMLTNAYKNRYSYQNTIAVTGLGEEEFTSDIIAADFSLWQENLDMKEAAQNLEKDREAVKKYLESKGVNSDEVIFKAISILQQHDPVYSADGRYIGSKFKGYRLSQQIHIESKEVEKIEVVSRQITDLISSGIRLESTPPCYYYSKLADLKLTLVSKATQDARERAEKIAAEAGAKTGKLKNAKMGVIQITAPNSNEDYSWGGSYNTSSKVKMATITMRLEYSIR